MAISEQLLEGINTLQIGNPRGFDVIYSETSSYVYARAKMIMKNEQDANDLVQDTYIQAYQNISSLRDPQSIFAWLGGITYRQGMKIYRKKNDVLLDEESEGLFEQIESEDIAWNPELSAEQQALGTIIAEIIDELPPLQKAALTAFYYDGMKIDQIARMYDCSSNTIKSRLNYAKKFVREKVETKEQQDNIRLHSVGGGLVILLGLRQLLSSPEYTMAQTVSEQIYSSLFQSLPLDKAAIPKPTNKKSSLGEFSVKNGSLKTGFLKNCSLRTKIAVIAGGMTVGTLTAVAIGFSTYHHFFPASSKVQNRPASVKEFNTPKGAMVTENSEVTKIQEPTEVSEIIEVSETTEIDVTEPAETIEVSESTKATETSEMPAVSQEQKVSDLPKDSDNAKKDENKKELSEFSFDEELSIDVTAD